jgi:nucleotide-binding universal stress UspA family protein
MATGGQWAEKIERGDGPVVCCVDGSDESRSAAALAAFLGDRLGLPLVLLSVVGAVTQPGVSAAPAGQERLAAEERREAEEALREVAAGVGAAEAELRVELGAAAARILAVCEGEGASLVVLGSRGRGRMKAAMLGSVSREVAARAPCPVLVVPDT